MGENENFLKSFAKTKTFAKTIPGTKIFRENFRENNYFCKLFLRIDRSRNEILQTASKFQLIFTFSKNEKGVFVSTLPNPQMQPILEATPNCRRSSPGFEFGFSA
jgi:hypothetical protein